MNWDIVSGKWNELKGQAHAKWAKLTEDDLEFVNGKLDALVGRLQQRYGHTREQAEREVDDFIRRVRTKPAKH